MSEEEIIKKANNYIIDINDVIEDDSYNYEEKESAEELLPVFQGLLDLYNEKCKELEKQKEKYSNKLIDFQKEREQYEKELEQEKEKNDVLENRLAEFSTRHYNDREKIRNSISKDKIKKKIEKEEILNRIKGYIYLIDVERKHGRLDIEQLEFLEALQGILNLYNREREKSEERNNQLEIDTSKEVLKWKAKYFLLSRKIDVVPKDKIKELINQLEYDEKKTKDIKYTRGTNHTEYLSEYDKIRLKAYITKTKEFKNRLQKLLED